MASKAPETTLTLQFVREKETANAVRFQEVHADDEDPRIGQLYVRKSTLGKLGNAQADKLSVTIAL